MDHWPAIWWLFTLLKTLCFLYFVVFAVPMQHAGDLLGIELICMCIEGIFRNSLMYSYAFFCFFRQCLSTLCTASVVFLLFHFVVLFFSNSTFSTEFLCMWKCTKLPLGVFKEPIRSFNERRDFRPSFLGRIPDWEITFFSVLSTFVLLPHFSKELSHFTIKDATFQYSPFEKCFGICSDNSCVCFVSVVVCFITSLSN